MSKGYMGLETIIKEKHLEEIYKEYTKNDLALIKKMVAKWLSCSSELSQRDYDDFYSLANVVFMNALLTYDSSRNDAFRPYFKLMMTSKFRSELSARSRDKRKANYIAKSTEERANGTNEDDDTTNGDLIASSNNTEEEAGVNKNEKVEIFLSGLPKISRRLLELKMDGYEKSEIVRIMEITEREYERRILDIRIDPNISLFHRKMKLV